MPNYKQTDVTGQQWTRANMVTINNPLNGVPSIFFSEENAVTLGTEVITRSCGNVMDIFNPAKEFDLIDPETGDPLGTSVTYGELYVMLNSLYRKLAADRDAAVIAEAERVAAEAASLNQG